MIFQLKQWVFNCSLVFICASCSILTPHQKCPEQDPALKTIALQKLENFLVSSIDIDYVAKCKARIVAGQKKFSGTCQLILTRNQELQLTILHPLGGTLLKLYADRRIIQVNDYSEKRYYELPANEIEKVDIPILKNLSIGELQAILWGRLIESKSGFLEYELEDNKVRKMFKRNSNLNLMISFTQWLNYKSMQFPRIIDMKNRKDGSSIKLVITEFDPGYVCNLSLSNQFH